MNTIICGDSEYTISNAYREGALALRRRTSFYCNPHRRGSQEESDWNDGHTNEAAGEHVRFGIDVIIADPGLGRCFEEDPEAPRNEVGEVDQEWYLKSLAAAGGQVPDFAMRLK